jgi:hypothetical protein
MISTLGSCDARNEKRVLFSNHLEPGPSLSHLLSGEGRALLVFVRKVRFIGQCAARCSGLCLPQHKAGNEVDRE